MGNVSEQVTVTADAPIVRAETASLGAVVEHDQVVQLPLNGRTFITLASVAPGVALPPNSQFPRINGGRPRTNEYLFDGISVLQPEPGQLAFFPVIDAIQEFKIENRDLQSCLFIGIWWRGTESNCRHYDFQSYALPTELPRPRTAITRIGEW